MAAAFSSNRCLWRGCGRIYSTRYDLIEHVEAYHIETDGAAFLDDAAQPPALPLSYICRFYPPGYTHRRLPTSNPNPNPNSIHNPSCKLPVFHPRRSSWDSDLDESVPTDYTHTLPSPSSSSDGVDSERPFVCPIPGCRKRYKNVNGIKYHAKHGHSRELPRGKLHACRCGKTYKSSSSFRQHCLTQHGEHPHPAPGTPTTPTATTPTSPPYAATIPAPPYAFTQAPHIKSVVQVPVMGEET
ncbi:juxtaposed with another zinc finger protein 1-like [Corticium candelabrum]|uniref:juxtaposed with another zinc finger protein 1-like n=1 Tax=Corticium candelabrum TaxID=121492 RepID=UPI002E25D1C7|nr:juxtaposed with another zinc finger protein 1-like [Corticium candelabrum]